MSPNRQLFNNIVGPEARMDDNSVVSLVQNV
jgi:hypothetical protein